LSNVEPLLDEVQTWWSSQHAHVLPSDGAWPGRLARLRFHAPCGYGCDWRVGRSNEQLDADLRRHVRAEAVVAARKLEDPSVNTSFRIATSLMPRPYGDEARLVADLIEAAGAQNVQARNRALVGAGFALVGVLSFFLWSSPNFRREFRKLW
jgi:hypothetical protein